MTETERELQVLRAEMDGIRHRQHRVLALLGTITLSAAVGIVLISKPARSDPATPFACGHPSSLYCFNANAPALAADVNSNFEAAFQELDRKLNLTGGTLTGNLTLNNLTINGTLSHGIYSRTAAGSGGGSTAVCNGTDFVLGGNVSCGSAAIIGAGSTRWGATQWGYYGTCAGGATATVTAFCSPKARE